MADPGPDIIDFQGQQMYRLHAELLWAYPFNPNSAPIILWAPMGGIGKANLPFMLKGDNGKGALLRQAIDFTALEYDDPTPDSATLVELTPGTDTTSQLSKLVLALHKGAPGADGTSTLNPATYGTPVYKRILQVNSAATGFEYTPQKVGGMYWPTGGGVTEVAAGTGTGKVQVETISIAANTIPFDWRPEVQGSTIVSASTADTVVDLTARIGTVSGTVVGKCKGIGGLVDRMILTSGPDAGTDPTTFKIAANAAATLLLVTEKQGGAGTYATGIVGESRFSFVAVPVP